MDFYTQNDMASEIINEKEFLTEFNDNNFFNLTTLSEDFTFKNEKTMENFTKVNSFINRNKASFDNELSLYTDNAQLLELENISYISSQHSKDVEKSYLDYNKIAEQENLYHLNVDNVINNNHTNNSLFNNTLNNNMNNGNNNNMNNGNNNNHTNNSLFNNTLNNNMNNGNNNNMNNGNNNNMNNGNNNNMNNGNNNNMSNGNNNNNKSNKDTMSYEDKHQLNNNTLSFSISKTPNNLHPNNTSFQHILPNSIITTVQDNTYVLHNTTNVFKSIENNNSSNTIINSNDGGNRINNSTNNIIISSNNNVVNTNNNFNTNLNQNNLNITTANNSKSYSCPSCSKNFSSEKYLSMHMSLHKPLLNPSLSTNAPNFGKSLLKVEDFLSQGISPIEKYKGKGSGKAASWTCKICMKTFAQNSNYKNHIRTHSNERPYECTICSIGFKERYHLKKHHLYVHSNQMNEKCGVCHKMFKDSTAVRAHLRTHSELRPYHCSRCGKAFKTSECLWHHENKSKTCAKNIINKGVTDLRKIIPKPMKSRSRNKLKTSVELVNLQNGGSEIKIENIVNGFNNINQDFQLSNTYSINQTISTSNSNSCGFYDNQQNDEKTLEAFEVTETHEANDNNGNSISETLQNNQNTISEHISSLTPITHHTTIFYSSPSPYQQIKLSPENNAHYNNTNKYNLPSSSSSSSLNNFYPPSYNIFIANNNTFNLINNNLEGQHDIKKGVNNDGNNFNEFISVTSSINNHETNNNYSNSINNNGSDNYINVSNNFSHSIKVDPSYNTMSYGEKKIQ